jgi:hypothetical protein
MTRKIPQCLAAASALFACALAAAITPADLPPNLGPNLALNKPYECIDKNSSAVWHAGLTDGSWNTAAASTFATANSAAFPKSVTIDLEKVQDLTAVLAGTPPYGATKTVAVSISEDGRKFAEVGTHDFEIKKADSHLFQFKPAKARYVRLTFAANHEKWDRFPAGFCFITEVEVFGTSGGLTQSGLGKPAPAAPAAAAAQPNSKPDLPRILNLALGCPYECDDPVPNNWRFGLTDGLWAMRRAATFSTNNTKKFPKNVTIDLRSSARLAHIQVGVPDFGSTKTIAVSVSYDGRQFTEVGRHDFPLGKAEARLFEFAPVLARQVRLTYLENYAEKNRFDPAVCFTTEVEVYAQPERAAFQTHQQ